ncbi:MAG: PAS domain-containing protein [Vicinamibacterales bacterium]
MDAARVLFVTTDLRDADVVAHEASRLSPGFEFDSSFSLQDATSRLGQHPYDAVLLDVLPRQQRQEAIAAIRSQHPSMPLVALIASTELPSADPLEAGADVVIPKKAPFVPRIVGLLGTMFEHASEDVGRPAKPRLAALGGDPAFARGLAERTAATVQAVTLSADGTFRANGAAVDFDDYEIAVVDEGVTAASATAAMEALLELRSRHPLLPVMAIVRSQGSPFGRTAARLDAQQVVADHGDVIQQASALLPALRRQYALRRETAGLRANELRIRTIVEAAPAPIALFTMDGVCLAMNWAGLALLGAARIDDVVGQPFLPKVGAHDHATFSTFLTTVGQGQTSTTTLTWTRPDGRVQGLTVSAVPLLREPGAPYGVLSSFTAADAGAHPAVAGDVGERELLARQLTEVCHERDGLLEERDRAAELAERQADLEQQLLAAQARAELVEQELASLVDAAPPIDSEALAALERDRQDAVERAERLEAALAAATERLAAHELLRERVAEVERALTDSHRRTVMLEDQVASSASLLAQAVDPTIVAQLQEDLAHAHERAAHLEQALADTQTLARTAQDEAARHASSTHTLAETAQRLSALEDELAGATARAVNAESQLRGLKAATETVDQLSADLAAARSEIETTTALRQRCDLLETWLHEAEGRCDDLTEQLAAAAAAPPPVDLTNRLAAFEADVARLEGVAHQAAAERDDARERHESVVRDLQGASAELAEMRTRLGDFEALALTQKALEHELQSAEHERQTLAAQVGELQARLAESDAEAERLSQRARELNATREQLARANAALDEARADAEKARADAENARAEAEAGRAHADAQEADAVERVRRSQAEVAALAAAMETAREQRHELLQRVSRAEGDLAQLDALRRDLHDTERRLDESESHRTELGATLDAARREVASHAAAVPALVEAEAARRVEAVSQALHAAEAALGEWRARYEDLAGRHRQTDEEHAHLAANLEAAHARLAEAERAIDTHRATHETTDSSWRERLADLERAHTEREARLSATVEELTAAARRKEDELGALAAQLDAATSREEGLRAVDATLNATRATLAQLESTHDDALRQLAEQTPRVEGLQAQVERLTSELERLTHDADEVRRRASALEGRLAESDVALRDRDGRLAALMDSAERERVAHERARSAVLELEARHHAVANELAQTCRERDALREAGARAESASAALSARLAEAEAAADALERQHAVTERTVLELRASQDSLAREYRRLEEAHEGLRHSPSASDPELEAKLSAAEAEAAASRRAQAELAAQLQGEHERSTLLARKLARTRQRLTRLAEERTRVDELLLGARHDAEQAIASRQAAHAQLQRAQDEVRRLEASLDVERANRADELRTRRSVEDRLTLVSALNGRLERALVEAGEQRRQLDEYLDLQRSLETGLRAAEADLELLLGAQRDERRRTDSAQAELARFREQARTRDQEVDRLRHALTSTRDDLERQRRLVKEHVVARTTLQKLLDDRERQLQREAERQNDDTRRLRDNVGALEARVARLSDVAFIGVAVTRLDGSVVHANDALASMLGYASAPEVLHAHATLPVEATADTASGGPGGRHANRPNAVHELALQRKDGRTVWLLEHRALTQGPDGEMLLERVVVDVTRPHEMASALRDAKRLESVGRLTSSMVDDLQRLLSGLRTAMQDGPGGRSLGEAAGAASKALALVNQLHAHNRRQARSADAVDVAALLHHARPMLRRLAGEDIDLVTEEGSSPTLVGVDRTCFEQLLTSLVITGRDALAQGGTIAIETVADASAPESLTLVPRAHAAIVVSLRGYGLQLPTTSQLSAPVARCEGLLQVATSATEAVLTVYLPKADAQV